MTIYKLLELADRNQHTWENKRSLQGKTTTTTYVDVISICELSNSADTLLDTLEGIVASSNKPDSDYNQEEFISSLEFMSTQANNSTYRNFYKQYIERVM